MNFSHPIILASKSPRRSELLSELGFAFEVRTKDVDESFPETMANQEVAKYLAEKKANGLGQEFENEIIIAADTVVIIDDEILGKPRDKKHATDMLKKLSGTKHEVITGVCIKDNNKTFIFDDTTEVFFKSLTDQEINFYIDEYKPFDKAGAYGIQEWIGMVGITSIKGSYFNVVGLPVAKVYAHLMKFR